MADGPDSRRRRWTATASCVALLVAGAVVYLVTRSSDGPSTAAPRVLAAVHHPALLPTSAPPSRPAPPAHQVVSASAPTEMTHTGARFTIKAHVCAMTNVRPYDPPGEQHHTVCWVRSGFGVAPSSQQPATSYLFGHSWAEDPFEVLNKASALATGEILHARSRTVDGVPVYPVHALDGYRLVLHTHTGTLTYVVRSVYGVRKLQLGFITSWLDDRVPGRVLLTTCAERDGVDYDYNIVIVAPDQVALALLLALLVTGCGTHGANPRSSASVHRPAPRVSSAPARGSIDSRSGTRTTVPAHHLLPSPSQLTPQGFWWAVDSTVPIDARSLANVRGYYRGHHDPVAWGRYLLGRFGLQPAEIDFAARHRIALYLLIPDANCSGCSGGDACDNDRTAAQASLDARLAVTAARLLRIPPGVTLFKDVEEVSSCHGELTGDYLDSWYRALRGTAYRPGFYGNATTQAYDFPRAYCAAAHADSAFRRDVILAQDEPEPAIAAPPNAIGPGNAPRFAPDRPRCAPAAATKIWQYGESRTDQNLTDVDEISPDTPGLLLPNGTVTR